MSLDLPVGIDGSGATRGAQQVVGALGQVQREAEKTAQTTTTLQRNLSAAFQTTGGSLQIAQGITQTATALGNLNVAGAAFSASRVLLEFGKTADDFRTLSAGVTKVTTDIYGVTTAVTRSGGAWAALGTIMRAHPLMTIASVLSIVASGMSLLGSTTEKTKTEFEELALSMQKAQRLSGADALLGRDGSGLARSAQIDAIRGGIAGTFAGKTPTLDELGQLLGLGRVDTLRLLKAEGNVDATSYLRTGYFADPSAPGAASGNSIARNPFFSQAFRTRDIERLPFTAEQARGALANYGRSLITEETNAKLRVGEGVGPLIYTPPSENLSRANFVEPPNVAELTARLESERERQEEAARKQVEAAEQVAAVLTNVSDQLAFGLIDAIDKGGSALRATLAGILRQQAGSALSNALSTVISAGVRGITGAQAGANATAPGSQPRQ